jgi:hypothetical protein
MIDTSLKTLGEITAEKLEQKIKRTVHQAGNKIQLLARRWDPEVRGPCVHQAGPIHFPRVDRVDPGVPVRHAPSRVRDGR